MTNDASACRAWHVQALIISIATRPSGENHEPTQSSTAAPSRTATRSGPTGQAGRLAGLPRHLCDPSNPPFARWFAGGTTNLCHNAVDRHLKDRPDQPALIYVSSETGTERTYSFRELHGEVQRAAAALKELGVQKGDRVLIYMPMIAEAAFAMLACARIGAIHSWCSAALHQCRSPRASRTPRPRSLSAPTPSPRRQGAGVQATCWTKPSACPATSPNRYCWWTAPWPMSPGCLPGALSRHPSAPTERPPDLLGSVPGLVDGLPAPLPISHTARLSPFTSSGLRSRRSSADRRWQ